MLRALRQAGPDAATRYLLILRFAVLNVVVMALLAAVWIHGWLDDMIATDVYHLVKLNVVVFLLAVCICAARIHQLSWELNRLRTHTETDSSRAGSYYSDTAGQDSASRALIAASLKMKFEVRLATIRDLGSTILFIGLTGTVIGFIIALGGVHPETASDAHEAGPMVAAVMVGMKIALYKTMAGCLLYMWLMINYRLLRAGTVHLVTGIIARGETHARV